MLPVLECVQSVGLWWELSCFVSVFLKSFFNFGPIINEFQKGHFFWTPCRTSIKIKSNCSHEFCLSEFSDFPTPLIKDELIQRKRK